MADHDLPTMSKRRWWRRAGSFGLGACCALMGQWLAGWAAGGEALLTLPVAIGLLLWLLLHLGREVVLALRWDRPTSQGHGGIEALCGLAGFGGTLLPRPWAGWLALGLLGGGTLHWLARRYRQAPT